jgi:hypothetical protein
VGTSCPGWPGHLITACRTTRSIGTRLICTNALCMHDAYTFTQEQRRTCMCVRGGASYIVAHATARARQIRHRRNGTTCRASSQLTSPGVVDKRMDRPAGHLWAKVRWKQLDGRRASPIELARGEARRDGTEVLTTCHGASL